MSASPYKDGLAMLDNLLDGKALPDHLARARAGVILPRHRTQAESFGAELRRQNDAIAKAAAEAMSHAPLVAVCFNHSCACGNRWPSFGFYARKVTQRIPGEGDATFTKRLDYPRGTEPVASTEWQTLQETECMSCFMREDNPATFTPQQ